MNLHIVGLINFSLCVFFPKLGGKLPMSSQLQPSAETLILALAPFEAFHIAGSPLNPPISKETTLKTLLSCIVIFPGVFAQIP